MYVKQLAAKLVDAIESFLILAIALLFAQVLLLLLGSIFPNELIISLSDLLSRVNLVTSVAAIPAWYYQTRQRSKAMAEMKERFSWELSYLMTSVNSSVQQFLPDFKGLTAYEQSSLERGYWTDYRNKGRIDAEMRLDMLNDAFSILRHQMNLERGHEIFLLYMYLTKYQVDLVDRFLSRLNKADYDREGTPENTFTRLLQAQTRNPNRSLDALLAEAASVRAEDVQSTGTRLQGQQSIMDRIAEMAKGQQQYDNLKRIVKRLILEGYISSEGLWSLLGDKGDLGIIVKSEAGLSGTQVTTRSGSSRGKPLNMFSWSNPTPFKKVLQDHGFILLSRSSYGTFVIPTDRMPPEYRNDLRSYLKHTILPEIESEWEKLRATYKHPRLRTTTFGYIAFVVRRDEIDWKTVNMHFRPEVEDLLVSMKPIEAAHALVVHTHDIPSVLKRMDVDAIVDNATEDMLLSLRMSEGKIRRGLSRKGFPIRDDRHRVLTRDNSRSHRKHCQVGLRRLSPTQKTRSRFNPRNSALIAAQIIGNANDLHNLLSGLGISV